LCSKRKEDGRRNFTWLVGGTALCRGCDACVTIGQREASNERVGTYRQGVMFFVWMAAVQEFLLLFPENGELIRWHWRRMPTARKMVLVLNPVC
jgi:hypothetical protein